MSELTLTRQDQLTVWEPKGRLTPKKAGETVCAFLDTATTSFGRATHYNTRQEQQAAELTAHDALLTMDRDVYAVLMGLPGVTDRARQIGLKKLLSSKRGTMAPSSTEGMSVPSCTTCSRRFLRSGC